MRRIEDEGYCTCCGALCEYQYGEENFTNLKKNLDNYKKYKDIFIYQCPNCGFISTDIAGEEGVLFGKEKDTYEYKQLYNYSYLQGLDKVLYDKHSQDVAANQYEAYSLVLKKQGEFEKCCRAINRCVELKLIMRQKYKVSQAELGGDEDNDDEYEKLYALIDESLKCNYEQINYFYDLVSIKSAYFKLLYAENLARQKKYRQATEIFEDVKRNNYLLDDLKDYFNELLSSRGE